MNRITKSKEMPVYLFHQGTNAHAWELLGAHRQQNGKTSFCTWAPHAAAVSVVGDFNGWDASAHPMIRLNEQGLWGVTVEQTADYDCYKYQITAADGRTLYKADPYAFHTQTPPENASKVYRLAGYRWHDEEWLAQRADQDARSLPVNIYELHIGSWRRNADGNLYSYLQLAEDFLISSGNKLFTLAVSDVSYFYSENKLTFVVTKNNKEYVLDFALDKLCEQLDPDMFFRTNRQTLVSVDAIQRIEPYFLGKAVVHVLPPFKDKIIVSKDKIAAFKVWLNY